MESPESVESLRDRLAACEKELDDLRLDLEFWKEKHADWIEDEASDLAEARVKVLEDEWATELIEKRMAALERAREERATHARVIESWKREEEGWREREKMLVEALEEMCEVLTCQCDVAYRDRGLHGPDCLKWIGDIARAALAGEE